MIDPTTRRRAAARWFVAGAAAAFFGVLGVNLAHEPANLSSGTIPRLRESLVFSLLAGVAAALVRWQATPAPDPLVRAGLSAMIQHPGAVAAVVAGGPDGPRVLAVLYELGQYQDLVERGLPDDHIVVLPQG